MSTYKIHFSTQDEYEDWVRKAGGRIDVLTIRNSASQSSNPGKPVVVQYRTGDQKLAPTRNTRSSMFGLRIAVTLVMVALIGAYAAFELNRPAAEAKLLKLDNRQGNIARVVTLA
jgi:hypothetical protein